MEVNAYYYEDKEHNAKLLLYNNQDIMAFTAKNQKLWSLVGSMQSFQRSSSLMIEGLEMFQHG